MLPSFMITLPPSSANGFYSSWQTYPELASPATSDSFSPPASPPVSPLITLPGGPANGFYASWQCYTDKASPTGSTCFSSSMSRPSSPLHTINEALNQRASWPVSPRHSEGQISEIDSRPTSMTTSMSLAYTVKSINSRKSRLTVLYPRPVRPQQSSCVEIIAESAYTSMESLVALSSRPVSCLYHSRKYQIFWDNEHIASAIVTLSALFDSSTEFASPPVERRLTASWKSLLKIKAYDESQPVPSFKAAEIFADTLLCVHNEIVESDFVDAQELTRPCDGLNEAYQDAYVLLYNSGAIPPAPAHISALDADLLKNFVVSIMQLVLVDALATLAVARAPSPAHKTDPDDDVIFNVPGWRQRNESRPTLPSAAGAPEGAVDNTLRLLLVTRHEDLEREFRGLRFLIWRANPRAKVELGNIVKQTLPLYHAELMKSPVADFVVHWQAAVVPSGHGADERTFESYDTDSW
ncbi:hypothetical protein B0F90DRAFT_1712384 [Multifurca ochricompacta]|uniref:Uncharacterized protein n=1 Tax=Multifurca ochricompacta TaxID=376703 RepID=A0AAD4M5C1_9AGAM|nr:hypothetical protein B0F90DRAFT_1712384 [Multifurca ochricompacta]